jgi:type II secretory ATPase GspE/PulE/Tfp pilus assembly ATPase PilB-like protein
MKTKPQLDIEMVQSSTFDSLAVALIHSLVEMLGLEAGSEPWGQLLEHFEDLKILDPRESWNRESYLELFAPAGEWSNERVFEELNRHYGRSTPPIDLELLSVGMQLHIPSLPMPIIPIARHPVTGCVTVVSSLPGLSTVLQRHHAGILKEFWCTDQVQAVWAHPIAIRAFLKRNEERIFLDPVSPHEDLRGLLEDLPIEDYPWIDAASLVVSEKHQRALGFSLRLMREVWAVPVFRAQSVVTVLASSKLNPHMVSRIQTSLRTTATVFQLKSEKDSINQLIDRLETQSLDPGKIFKTSKRRDGEAGTGHIDKISRLSISSHSGEDTEAVQLVNTCLFKGIQQRASDIIFATARDRLRVRYKVDGEWEDDPAKLPVEFAQGVINHLKIKSGLNISVKRIPQDGHLRKEVEGKQFVFRVNISPDMTGETATLRIQRHAEEVLSLEEYGMPDPYVAALDRMMAGSTGLIILSGPTGCGKSTTIYSMIKRQDPIKQNILTCEAPVEIEMPNISQLSIEDSGPMTFELWTRSLLRRATCIGVVGEMRDRGTVEAVMLVSSSGHRVISTLHTNSAWDISTRLMEFGADPFYIVQTLSVGLSQRLVRNICVKCATNVPVPSSEKLCRMGLNPDRFASVSHLKQGRGCPFCQNRGTYGRRAIFEAMIVDEEIKEAIRQKATSNDLRKISERRGERTIFEKALDEVIVGRISLDEACRTRTA